MDLEDASHADDREDAGLTDDQKDAGREDVGRIEDQENMDSADDRKNMGRIDDADEQCSDGMKKTKEEYRIMALPEPLQTWRKVLKDVWMSDQDKHMKHELCQSILNNIFDECDDPLHSLLTLHKCCPDFGAQKTNSLAGFVLRHFQCWMHKNDRFDQIHSTLNRDLKIEAFTVGICKHTAHLELIAGVFELRTDEIHDHIVQTVKEMITLRNYRDAIAIATLFELQSYFTVDELVIPCMLQDRFVAVDAFIKNEKKMQKELVRHFDDLIGLDGKTVAKRYEHFRSRKIMTIPMSKLQKKAIEKLVSKLLLTYNLSAQEVAPNLTRCRQEGALRHMVFLYFNEHGVSEEGYFDYVSQALQSNVSLQKYFISYLCSNGIYEDAVRWVVFCDMFDHVPYCIRPYLTGEAVHNARINLERMSKRLEVEIINLFPGHAIKMISDAKDLNRLYTVIENADVIGIDTEWKPLFMSTTEQVALFQVCVWDCSYLVDIIELENKLTQEQWRRFFQALFCDSNAIKLGFDFLNDLRVLRTSFPYLQPLEQMKNVVCMVKLVNSLLASNAAFLDLSQAANKTALSEDEKLTDISFSEESVHFRLTDLCQKVLGEALDKREQIGNWAMRPLRFEQMKYAAMDGYCLLKLYEKLKEKAESEFNMNWKKHLEEGFVARVKSKDEKKTRKKAKFDNKEFQEMIERVNADLNGSQMKRTPKELKIVVDSMMLGLGKHLRRCGIDTILADSRIDLIDCVEKDPKRYVITCGKATNELRKHRSLRGTERVLAIPLSENMSMIQQIEFVLRKFNTVLSRDDIFSRCMNCNSDAFVIAPSPVLEAMYQANVVALNPFNEEIYDAAKYNEKMQKVDAAMYSGYGCSLEFSKNDCTWVVAHCYNGVLDIEEKTYRNCLVAAVDRNIPVEVKIDKVPLPILEKEGRFFYICGDCGKVYWDGCHISNYNGFLEPLFRETIV